MQRVTPHAVVGAGCLAPEVAQHVGAEVVGPLGLSQWRHRVDADSERDDVLPRVPVEALAELAKLGRVAAREGEETEDEEYLLLPAEVGETDR